MTETRVVLFLEILLDLVQFLDVHDWRFNGSHGFRGYRSSFGGRIRFRIDRRGGIFTRIATATEQESGYR